MPKRWTKKQLPWLTKPISKPAPDQLPASSEPSPGHLLAISQPSPGHLLASSQPAPGQLPASSWPAPSQLPMNSRSSPCQLPKTAIVKFPRFLVFTHETQDAPPFLLASFLPTCCFFPFSFFFFSLLKRCSNVLEY